MIRALGKPQSRHADRPLPFHGPLALDEELSLEQAELLPARPEPRSKGLKEGQHDIFLADFEHCEQLSYAYLEFELVHEHELYRQSIAKVNYARVSVHAGRVCDARERAGRDA